MSTSRISLAALALLAVLAGPALAPALAQGRGTCIHDLVNAPLECVGREPFFILTISGARAEFSRLGQPIETWYAADCRYGADEHGEEDRKVFIMPLRDLGSNDRGEARVTYTGYCDIGLSETRFDGVLGMTTPAGEAITGCCRLKPHTGKEEVPED